MDKRKVYFADITGQGAVLKRNELREAFSKIGKVIKIYIDAEKTVGKVYFENARLVNIACNQLNGHKGWTVVFGKEDFKFEHNDNREERNEILSSSNNSLEFESMMEEAVLLVDYVDAHGRPLDVVLSDNGQLYVKLVDIQNAGFNIFPKQIFENTVIPKHLELKEFEEYLFNQGLNYVLKYKKTFNEAEMLSVFENVRAKLLNKEPTPVTAFESNKQVNKPESKNFTITARNDTLSSTNNNSFSGVPLTDNSISYEKPITSKENRTPKQLPENFQPSFSFTTNNKRYSNESRPECQNKANRPSSDERLSQSRGRNLNIKSGGAMWDKKGDNLANGIHLRTPKSTTRSRDSYSKPIVKKEVEEDFNEPQDIAISTPKPKLDVSSTGSARNLINYDKVKLDPNSRKMVKVSYVSDKLNIFFGTSVENNNLIEEILLDVNTNYKDFPIIEKPTREMLVVAKFEDLWYRAVVLHGRPTPGHALVDLIDYGNREEIIVPVRQMPEEMKKIPAQAIRFAVNNSSKFDVAKLSIDQQIEVFVKKHYDDLTHLVEIKRVVETDKLESASSENSDVENFEAPSKPALIEECFMEVPPTTAKIVPNEMVLIVNYTNDKLILRNKETALLCKQIYSYLTTLEKKSVTSPKVGQLVLCSSADIGEGYHRAIIKEINGKAATLELIDYHAEDTLSLVSLRNFDKTLASFPRANIELDYPYLEKATDDGQVLLSTLIVNKTKIKAVQNNDQIDFLFNDEGKEGLLSEKILPKPDPSSIKPEQTKKPEISPTPTKNEEYVKFTYDEMSFKTPKVGVADYSCYSCVGTSLTLVELTEENVNLLEKLNIGEPEDKTPYTPELFEMCLAKFDDEWYRGLVTDEDNGEFEIIFVEYGNIEKLSPNDLRKFPENLRKIPILGINARLQGIKDSEKVHKRLKELIEEGSAMQVDVKSDQYNDDLRYPVEIPEVYATLRKEGLI